MPPATRVLRLYTRESDHPQLDWQWVQEQLESAGTYWVIARSDGYPHPRPVWGIWLQDALHLSIGRAGRESFQQTGSWTFDTAADAALRPQTAP